MFETITHVISGFVGVWLGYRLKFFSDDRLEFNQIADRVFLWLDAEQRNPDPHRQVPRADLLLLRRRLRWKALAVFDRREVAYKDATQEGNRYRDQAGQVFYKEVEKVRNAVGEFKKSMHWPGPFRCGL